MTLPSGLEVLLVSTTKLVQSKGQPLKDAKAAAAMCVQVGSFADPAEAEGLAHFLEHMVFMGSAKYPSENQYDQYINSHSGECNAFTEGEYTVYQFDIASEFLHRALDMFANCFISPLFKKNATDRELKAIDSEFNLASTNDDVRIQQLFSHFVQPGHVLNKFSWGNLRSLQIVPKQKGVDMDTILRSFHRTHYGPQNMKLVVVAPQSLDEIGALVGDCFGGWSETTRVENDAIAWLLAQEDEVEKGGKGKKAAKSTTVKGKQSGNSKKARTTPSSVVDLPSLVSVLEEQKLRFKTPLAQEDSALLTRVVPIKATHRLALMWQIPPTQHGYRSKNEQYLCHLIGHEGEGGIISHLKDLGLATFLECGCDGSNFESNSMITILRVQIVLTAKGLANWMNVAKVVVQYLKMLRCVGPQEWVFRELQRVCQLEYNFLDEEAEEELAERLCVEMSPMLARAREDLLSSAFLLWEWDPVGICALLDFLDPQNMHTLLLSSAFGVPDDQVAAKEAGTVNSDDEDDNEDWGDVSESASSEGDDVNNDGAAMDESKGAKGKRASLQTEEALPLSPVEIEALYSGPPEWLSVVRPPVNSEQSVKPDISKKCVEPHFGTTYWREELPSGIRELWQTAWDVAAAPEPRLHLPAPNPYIPDNLALVPPTDGYATPSATKDLYIDEPVPVRVRDDPGMRVWHMVDPRFPFPKVGIYVRLASPVPSSTARNAAINDLSRLMLYDCLEKELYTASMAELHTSISSIDLGLEIKVKGFSDKAPVLLRTVVQAIAHPESFVSESVFQLQYEKLIRMYRNDGLKSSSAATGARLVALKPSAYSSRDKSKFLQQRAGESSQSRVGAEHSDSGDFITSQCVMQYMREFLRKVSVEILVHGNMSRSEVLALCEDAFCSGNFGIDGSAHPDQVIVKLPVGIPTILRQAPRNPSEPSVCVELYYQFGPIELAHTVKIDLLEQILYEPFYDQLRTKQQLGYSVSCSGRSTYGVLGFLFSVVSSAYTVKEVQKAILAYVATIPRYLASMPKPEYRDHVESLINEKKQPPASLFDAFADNYSCLVDRRYDFDTRREEAELLKVITREDISAFAKELTSVSTRRLMSIQASLEIDESPLEDCPAAQKQTPMLTPHDVKGATAVFWPNLA